jgi:hypothetical protein
MVRPFARDLMLSIALALVLGAVWTVRDWAQLSVLSLPDTDDSMRLVQVRDWIGGQAWRDLTQHRLGAGADGGLPMHWTRLGDLGPAALIVALTPLIGTHAAETAAIVAWPILLFAVALVLVGRIARAVDPALAATATVVAALAYPASTVFLPGRIDHHGLLLVLLLGAVLATLGRASLTRGIVFGAAAAASLVVGLETMPFLAVLGAAMIARWALRPSDAAPHRVRLIGVGIGALGGLIVALGFAPAAFAYPACDGFTAQAWRAAMILACVPLVLPLMPVGTAGQRLGCAVALGAIAVALALIASPACLSPYGAVDARLKAAWLVHVSEAQPLFGAPVAAGIGYAGVLVVGLGATAWQAWRTRDFAWITITVLLSASLVVACVQLRGAYAGALLAAPGIAAMIAAARVRGTLALAGAWIGGAGIVYPAVASRLFPAEAGPPAGTCLTPRLLDVLAALPVAEVLAPIDDGPSLLLHTRHRVLAAPYHRNASGNLRAIALYAGRAAKPPPYGLSCPVVGNALPVESHPIARDGDAMLWALSVAPRAR